MSLTMKVGLIAIAVALGFGLFVGYAAGVKKASSEIRQTQIYFEEQRKLTEQLRSALLTQTTQSARIEEEVRNMERNFDLASRAILDSLRPYIVAIGSGEGNVPVENSGIALHGKYQDPWLHIAISGDTANPKVDYGFNFKINNVDFLTEDKQGIRRDIYSVFLRSTYDTSKTLFLGDYQKTFVTLPPARKEVKSGFEYSPSVMFGAEYSFREHATLFALGVSLCDYSTDRSTMKGTVFKVPIVGIASDIGSRFEATGTAGVNIGHWMPVFEDLYLVGGIGYSVIVDRLQYLIGISTTL